MINTANSTASLVNGLDAPGAGFVKASVVRGPDSAGVFTLRLDGGREMSVIVEEGKARADMTPGQNVFINPSNGMILVPETAQEPQPPLPEQSSQSPLAGQQPQSTQTPQPPIAGETPQSAQTPVQPFAAVRAETFTAGEIVKQIRDGLESPLLRSLPAELIEKIANERGGIDVAALNALDAILRNRSIPADASSPHQLERLEQWLRLVLDNPKLIEDLAGRIPLAGAREIIDKFLQLQRLGMNFLPNNLLQQLSAERFFLGNASGNTVNGELLKELFAKAFSAAPAALLDLVKRIDSSDINANNVKLPPEEARRILGELVNRLPTQAAGKPELVHDIRQLPPRIAEAAAPTIPNKPELPNTHVIPNKPDLSYMNILPGRTESLNKYIIPDRAELPAVNIIPNKSESPNINIISNKSELSNTHIISNKYELSNAPITPNKPDFPNINIIPNKSESPNINIISNKSELSNVNIISNKPESPNVNIIPNKPESPNVNIISNKPESPNVNIIPNKPESPNVNIIPNKSHLPDVNIIPNKSELSSVNTIPNRPESPNVNIIPNRADLSNTNTISNKSELPGARHPVPQNTYERIESSPRFNIPAENKNAVFSQIGAAQEAIRQVIDGSARAEAAIKQVNTSNVRIDNNITQQATISGTQSPSTSPTPQPKTEMGQATVIPTNTNDIRTDNTVTQQATISGTPPPKTETGEVIVKQANTSGVRMDSNINKHTAQLTQQAINITTDVKNTQTAPDTLTQAARRLLDNTEKLRSGFQAAFSSLDLQSRVFPSDFSGGAEASAIRRSLDALRLETLLNASKSLQNIFSIVDELRGVVEFFSDKSLELARTAENLARQARQSGNEIADRLSDILRELNRMQPDDLKGDTLAAARRTPAEIMRSAALTAAGGLESLNLLASTARGQELQQQVIALPVKIGEEWTEVQVKIIKERKGKGKKEKKEGDGHVSVYLNVAPSMLGEVTAHLDYHPPASLKISFQFGKPEAARWFRERTTPLREALSAAGLPGAALEFHTMRRPVRARRADGGADDAQLAENQAVTPVGANMADGSGRVDFRI